MMWPSAPEDQQPFRPGNSYSPAQKQPRSPGYKLVSAQEQYRMDKASSSSSEVDADDIWLPFTRFGFDSNSLRFADSNILMTRDGNVFKYEKIVPASTGDTISFKPLSVATHLSGPPQHHTNTPSPQALETRPAPNISSTFTYHVDDEPRTLSFDELYPTVPSNPRYTNDTPEHITQQNPSQRQPADRGQNRDSISENARLPEPQYRTDEPLHPSRIRRRAVGPEYHDVAQRDPRQPAENTRPNLASPFPSDIYTSLEHHIKLRRTQDENTLDNGTAESGPALVQVSPTIMALPSEYFAHSNHNAFRTHDTNSSSPIDTEEHPFSEEAAVNAPIYVGSDAGTAESSRSSNEHVFPGEVLVFKGAIQRSTSFSSPFQPAFLRIFRHTITQELRFYSRATSSSGNDTDTCKMQYSNTELVPTYAYDISKDNIVYLRELSRAKSGLPQNCLIYKFLDLKDLISFQRSLLEEDVHLDISSLRFLTLIDRNGSQRRVDFARLQIWHEQSQNSRRSDAGSIMTAGTALSGPLTERTRPTCSRLMLFLGRAEEYLSIFVTDDITIDQRGSTTISLKATRYSGIDYFKSRTGIRCFHAKTKKCASGIPLTMKGLSPDDEESFDQLKAVELEFENEKSLIHFWQTWNNLVRLRRKQRLSIQNIQDDMSRRLYYGSIATRIL